MTDTATAFAVGDLVRAIHRLPNATFKAEGEIVGIRANGEYAVSIDQSPGRVHLLSASQLERIDVEPEAPTDDAAMSASVEGPSPDDSSGTGTAAEPAAEEPTVPSIEDLATQVATLTERITIVEGLLQFQNTLNREAGYSFEALHNRIAELQPKVDGTFRHLEGAPRTTKRVHTKIVKNTKGYGFELSAEVTSDDPIADVNSLTAALLDQADLDAREQIKHAEYRDQYGLPGDDEVTTF